MEITNIEFDQDIYYPNNVERFTEIPEINPIPTDSIIYKTVCGIGATHSEIVSLRDSIIVLPHLSIVKGKHADPKYSDITFAVHGGVTWEEVFEFLVSGRSGYAKLLTTPAGLEKIIKASNKVGFKWTEYFFILIDECHKIIQDADYRGDMVKLMDKFFECDGKAMISATPIPPSDPRFRKKGFRHIKVSPISLPKTPITIFHTNSVTSALKEVITDNPCESYFIFFNSLSGILSLIKNLKLNKDSKIFCSEEYKKSLQDKKIKNVFSTYTTYAKYNFLTSSFYNGLDIEIKDFTPKVIIISDCGFGDHCVVDPFTGSLQIIGRFRGQANLTPVHINNESVWLNPLDPKDALDEVKRSENAYNILLGLENAFIGIEDYHQQALRTIKPYYNLLDRDKKFSFFLNDNYLDENRVKQYYSSTSKLLSAYSHTNLFNLDQHRRTFESKERIKLTHHKVKYLKKTNINTVEQLKRLEQIKGTDTYYNERQKIKSSSPIFFNAFEKLGIGKIIELKYNRKIIERELLTFDINEKKNSYPLFDLIQEKFQLNRSYSLPEIKDSLQELNDELQIPRIAKATDIELYYFVKAFYRHKPKTMRMLTLTEKKFNVVNT